MINLITGGAGFIGSHLAEYILAKREKVIVIDDLSTGRFENIKTLIKNPKFKYYIGKVEDQKILERVIEQVDKIYHLAAAVGVKLIVEDPVKTIETNINATQSILEHAVTFGKKVLIASSSEVYGKGNNIPFSEDGDVTYGPTVKPRWSYAFSKATDEFLFLAYHKHKGLPGVVVRLFNTVGPRQTGRYGMVIPRFVNQAMSGGPITVYGNGKQTRCFAHVLDVVPALYELMNCSDANGEVVNVGNDEEISIIGLAERVRSKINKKVKIIRIPYEKVYGLDFEDMGSRRPKLNKLKGLINYKPRRNLNKIINDVINYEKNANKIVH